jgi:putative ABC transport system permease protein
MTKLFGLPMSTLAVIMAVLFAVCLLSVVAIWISNRTMFRLGLRNVPRRGAQATLIVLGLMLGTLIITASFATGDSLAYSITKGSYDLLHRVDLLINFQGTDSTDGVTQVYVPQTDVATLQQQFVNSPTIQSFAGFDFEALPVLDTRTNLSKPNVMLAGADPQQLASVGGLSLQSGGSADLTQLTGNNVFVSKMTADKLNVKNGDTLTVFVNGKQQSLHVVGIVKNEGAGGVLGNGDINDAGGISVPLALVQQMTGHANQVNLVTVTLRGTERSTLKLADSSATELNSYFKSGKAQQALGLGSTVPQAVKIKQNNVNSADLFGNLITTVFLVLGLFSIAAGVLLIFMIFVMLAAERKAEMGMARAVGAQRINLVQAFVAEGMAYDVLAGFIGAALGVAAAFALVILGLKLVLGSQGNFFSAHVTGTSLVISYCLGAVVTFITIVISSFRVSRLNIVSAIRGTDEDETRAPRGHFSIWWTLLGIVLILTTVLAPLGLIILLRKGIGLPWFWVFVPMGVIISLIFLPLAHNTGQAFFLTTAVSLLILCGGGIARRFGARSRAVWTIAGLLLLFFWLTPIQFGPLLVGKKTTGGIEMFVLSGIMIVAAFALVIVFNANLLTKLFVSGEAGAYRIPALMAVLAVVSVVVGVALGDNGGGLGQLLYLLAALFVLVMLITLAAARFPRLAPALKMAIAYPVANRFRTGMTIAMFSLIIFSLTVMSVLNSNFANLLAGNDAHGSWDVIATVNKNNPIGDLVQTLQGTGKVDTSKITASGQTSLYDGVQQVQQEGVAGASFKSFPISTGNDSFFANTQAKLNSRANGYNSDSAVWQAIKPGSGLAVISNDALPAQGGFGGVNDRFQLKNIKGADKTFAPFTLDIRNPVSGATGKVTVIGIISTKIPIYVLDGIYTDAQTYSAVYGQPDLRQNYLRLQSKTNPDTYAKSIESALMTQGVQAFSIQNQINTDQAQSQGFSRIFQGFMGLGLLVGIAAIGVIGFRSVVERRQQIGMLRAIGYQRGTVALSFVLESSFIAAMGIISGVIGAAILSRNLITSDAFGQNAQLHFSIPWVDVIVFVVVAYVFSLLMTYWPSRGAANIVIAEALRYE